MMCLKSLLGVRSSTTNNLCLVELGYPPLKSLVKSRQRKFMKKMFHERRYMVDDPFIFAVNNLLSVNISTSRYMRNLIHIEEDDIGIALGEIKLKINSADDSNRCIHYKEVNPNLSVNNIYSSASCINELERMSWTKMRLGAHSLAIETGRWNRRGQGRLPIDQRLCSCGEVQTERHVIESCPLTNHCSEA